MEQKSNIEGSRNARAFLRERFLRTLTALIGMKCVIRMHDNTTVEGTFKGCDSSGNAIIVTDLKTPFNLMPQTIIRMSDVIHMTFENIELKPSENNH